MTLHRTHRLDKNQARKLISEIANRYPAHIRFSRHALEEIQKDDLTIGDIMNVIKSPSARIVHEAEFERGSYRYRLQTTNITVVIAFNAQNSFIVVTAWRNKI